MSEKENKKKNPHANHRARVRETFRKAGADAMPDHNLLELLLFYSIPRKDTNELAHRLIETFGSLNNVFDASYEQLLHIDGMGESSALLISMITSICRRYTQGNEKGKINLSEPAAAAEYMIKRYYGVKNEIIYMLCLDVNGNVITCSKIAEGIPNTVVFDRRNVVETAIRTNADKIILVHNHPGGVAVPSKNDLETTSEIKSLLRGIGVALADHIIIADNDYISLASVAKFSALFI